MLDVGMKCKQDRDAWITADISLPYINCTTFLILYVYNM